MFVKDGNEKSSKHCLFTQVADLIAFAAFSKIRGERQMLDEAQREIGIDRLYDAVPQEVLNTRASNDRHNDAIVRLT